MSQAPGTARRRQDSVPASVAEASPSIPQPDDENCFRILLATDNHIGYAEKDPVRGQDAINTFREILELARDLNVDFILLGGDLFHENRPSRTCMHQTIALLREYTLGDKPIPFELLSDPMAGATPGFSFPAVNYEDPNLNIAIPVFSIHGNHDDPQGTGPEGALCALDVLSVSGTLNYFGKVDLVSDEANETEDKGIKIRPVLLRKGTTNLALYGVGNVKDARMHYELRSNRVKMFMPQGGDIGEDDWFNLLVIHQNRVKHGQQQSVPEGMFDDSIKLVLWGHEHDCRIWPEAVEGKPYYITQPGSSVATSLAPGEALPKHVGLLSVQGDRFQIAEIPLKTVRPFELDELVLTEEAAKEDSGVNLEDKDTITACLREKVEELIQKARAKWEEDHDAETEEMMLPLIRLKVETSEAKEMTNPVRFGQDFVGRVANPRDILQYHRKKSSEKKSTNRPDAVEIDSDDELDPAAMTTSDRLAKIRMGNLVRQYLQAQNLEVLIEGGLEEAVMRFVDKGDKDAIKDFVDDSLKNVGREMRTKDVDEDGIQEELTRAKEAAAAEWVPNENKDKGKGKKSTSRGRGASKEDSMEEEQDSMMEEDSMEEEPAPKKTTRKPAARSTKASTKAPTSKSTAAKKKAALFSRGPSDDEESEEEVVSVDDDSEEEVTPPPKRGTASRRGAAAKSAPARAAKATKASPAKSRATTSRATTRGRAAASQPVRQSQLNFQRKNLVDSDSD